MAQQLTRFRTALEEILQGRLQADLLRLYRLWYALAETSVYLLQFRARHTIDNNMVESWQNFLTFLPGGQGSIFRF